MIAQKQQAELEHILGKLRSDLATAHNPVDRSLQPGTVATAQGRLRKKVRCGVQTCEIMHHEQGKRLIGRYRRKITVRALKVTGQRMKAEHSAEIREHRQMMELGMWRSWPVRVHQELRARTRCGLRLLAEAGVRRSASVEIGRGLAAVEPSLSASEVSRGRCSFRAADQLGVGAVIRARPPMGIVPPAGPHHRLN